MAQSLFTSPSPTIRSPVPKRFRLSLKQDKLHFQESVESPVYKKIPTAEFSIKSIEDLPTNNLKVQNENISPNCRNFESQLSVFVNVEVVDYNEDVEAVGLPNIGNTCFANCIIQVLRYTPNFLNSIHSLISLHQWLSLESLDGQNTPETQFFTQLHLLFSAMKKQEDFLFKNYGKDSSIQLLHETESFLAGLREVTSLFEEGEQHDAYELLLSILSIFSNYMKTDFVSHCRSQDSTVISDTSLSFSGLLNTSPSQEKRKLKKVTRRNLKMFSIEKLLSSSFDLGFEGTMQHSVKCLECENVTKRDEEFKNLNIYVTEDLVDEGIASLLECLPNRTMITGENKYFCEECNHQNEAEISYSITTQPSILLIHCSWLLKQSSFAHFEKDSTKFVIPMTLKTSESTLFQTSSNDVYYLYAVILHLGTSTENGHYVSFVRDRPKPSELVGSENHPNLENCCGSEEILNLKLSSRSRWLLFDDENVCPISVNENCVNFPYYEFLQISASPSLLFYYKM